jgi:hypothetical protein
MDSELIDYLKAMESRLDGKLEGMESRFDEKLEKMEVRLEGKLDAVEQRIHDHVAEVVHDSETRIVGTFMKIVHAHETRMSLHESTNTALLTRVALLEARMLEIERQRPPQ